jgi:hypothetical protein
MESEKWLKNNCGGGSPYQSFGTILFKQCPTNKYFAANSQKNFWMCHNSNYIKSLMPGYL